MSVSIEAASRHRPVEKWIGLALVADARSGSMPADETHIVAQRQKFFRDRANERGKQLAARIEPNVRNGWKADVPALLT